jgi:hypothetical protein
MSRRRNLKVVRRVYDGISYWRVVDVGNVRIVNRDDGEWLSTNVFVTCPTRSKARAWLKKHRREFELDA